MTEILKLTGYLAERERYRGRFLTDAMLELFARREVATSIVLRGIASFGPRNVARTDELLSMSEDLPAVVVAADTAERIAGLAEEVAAIIGRGLLTVERARLIDQSGLPDPHDDEAVRMTLFLGRRQWVGGAPAHVAATAVLHRLGFAGAIGCLGVDGTVGGRRRRAGFLSRNVEVPMLLLAVGTRRQARAAAAELRDLLGEVLLTVERLQICKHNSVLHARPHPLPATDAAGLPLFQKVTVFTDEDARHDGQPIHRALVARLRESHAAGATAVRGVWGFTAPDAPHGDRMSRLSRRVPVATVLIDTPAGIAASFGIVDELTAEHGLVTSELVPAALSIDGAHRHGGIRLARHDC